MRRRAFLRTAAVGAAGGLAGCSGVLPGGEDVPPVDPVPPRATAAPAATDLGRRVWTYDQRVDGLLARLVPSLGGGPEPHKLLVVNVDAPRAVRVALWGEDHGVLVDRREQFPAGGYLAGVLTEPDDYTLAVVADDAAGHVRFDEFDCNPHTTAVTVESDGVGAATSGLAGLCGI